MHPGLGERACDLGKGSIGLALPPSENRLLDEWVLWTGSKIGGGGTVDGLDPSDALRKEAVLMFDL